ncbi:MAG: hypothetical protein CSA95_08850 [Bacteroidetes bacterium]|nr:MAG: hypothetical protein CSA95_08850 [Bacteroidota bacterium]
MKKGILLVGLVFMVATIVVAQERMELSLSQAQEYAVANGYEMRNARYGLDSADESFLEVLSSVLPQVKANASLSDNLKMMTTLIPAVIFNPMASEDDYMELKFGMQFNTGLGLQASQLLFNAPVLVGIQTAKIYKQLAEQGIAKTEQDVKESVAYTYYLILVSQESAAIIEDHIANLEQSLRQTEKMVSVGMAEETAVDEVKVALIAMENTRSGIARNVKINYNLLRFQLGLPGDTELLLTGTLEEAMRDVQAETLLEQSFLLDEHIDMQMVETQQRLAMLALKEKRAQVLPSLVGFYNYNYSGQGDELFDQRWFPSSVLGLQLDVPLFAGGLRRARIAKAKIEVAKLETSREMLSSQLLMQERQLRYNLKTALEKFRSEKERLLLAERVLENYRLKYRQGIISSMELIQSNNNYLQSANNHISAMVEVLQAKVALDKLLNNL